MGQSQGSSSSSSSYQLDTTSGMDEAIKRADALAEAVVDFRVRGARTERLRMGERIGGDLLQGVFGQAESGIAHRLGLTLGSRRFPGHALERRYL
jgi:hypothetical protein